MRVFTAVLLIAIANGCGAGSPPAQQDVLFGPSMQPGTVDEAAAQSIAKRSVDANDANAKLITLKAMPEGNGWWVLARLDFDGRGENRSIHIDERGAVTQYGRGSKATDAPPKTD